MNRFDYATGLVSILVGIALSDVMMSLHRLLRHRHRVTWDGRVLLSTLFVILSIVTFWFNFWTIRMVKDLLSFPVFMSAFFDFMVLFLACAACLPDEPREDCDLRMFYGENKRYLWSLFAILQAAIFAHAIYFVAIRSGHLKTVLTYGAKSIAPLPVYLLLGRIRSRWFEYVALIGSIIYLIYTFRTASLQ